MTTDAQAVDGPQNQVQRAQVADAPLVAELLDGFNREFHAPTPGIEVLTARLQDLLAHDDVAVLLCGQPATGLAVLSFRPSVWFEGLVATLDELYVRPQWRRGGLGHSLLERAFACARERGALTFEINVDGEDLDARRFYEAHGLTHIQPGATEPMYHYYRDID